MRSSKVELSSLHVCKTYDGFIEGAPTPTYLIEHAKYKLANIWGTDRPVYVVGEQDILSYIDAHGKEPEDKFSRYLHMAWFRSWTPVEDKNALGSHLFMIWWADKIDTEHLEEFASCNWGHAKDFDL